MSELLKIKLDETGISRVIWMCSLTMDIDEEIDDTEEILCISSNNNFKITKVNNDSRMWQDEYYIDYIWNEPELFSTWTYLPPEMDEPPEIFDDLAIFTVDWKKQIFDMKSGEYVTLEWEVDNEFTCLLCNWKYKGCIALTKNIWEGNSPETSRFLFTIFDRQGKFKEEYEVDDVTTERKNLISRVTDNIKIWKTKDWRLLVFNSGIYQPENVIEPDNLFYIPEEVNIPQKYTLWDEKLYPQTNWNLVKVELENGTNFIFDYSWKLLLQIDSNEDWVSIITWWILLSYKDINYFIKDSDLIDFNNIKFIGDKFIKIWEDLYLSKKDLRWKGLSTNEIKETCEKVEKIDGTDLVVINGKKFKGKSLKIN